MRLVRVTGLILCLTLLCATAWAQDCDDPHYRWTEKIDASLASSPATKVSIGTIIRRWGLLPFTRQAVFKCADREGRELRTHSVLGWVRRVKKHETDGDWHVELTVRKDTPIDSCIVAEIPPAELSGLYRFARESLDSLLSGTHLLSNGDVEDPVHLRFIGPAFFDGQHRGGPDRRDQTDGAHGRCNSSARALWEIHPVYWVTEP